MISLVVVSHSPALAKAAVDLALEMVAGDKPAIAIAAGAGGGIIGTDAVAVAAAIDEVATPEGVLVIMDLGSAVMSAEMALDFISTDAPVKLSSAPFVEGLLAAIVTASGGASLDDVDAEARSALLPKTSLLGEPDVTGGAAGEVDAGTAAVGPTVADPTAADSTAADPTAAAATAAAAKAATPTAAALTVAEPPADPAGQPLVGDVTVLNPDGLHARPASQLVTTVAAFEAKLTLSKTATAGKPVAVNSMMGLLSLGGKQGDVLTLSASGIDAQRAFDTVTALFSDGFGELGGEPPS